MTAVFHRYVAIGDSFTEGVGDPDETRPNGLRGWADRVAQQLSTHTPDFGYANLAIRGRLLRPILAEQLDPAIALQPDLITINAGANDLLRPKVDIDGIVAAYEEAIRKLVATDARVLVWTGFDLGWAPVFGKLRGRVAIYNELVREIADTYDVTLVDFWRLTEYRDQRLWDVDRMHMSPAGHQRMAIEVLNTLGVEHTLIPVELGERPRPEKKQQREADLEWAKAYAMPWVQRRLKGTSSGDGVRAKRPNLEPIGE